MASDDIKQFLAGAAKSFCLIALFFGVLFLILGSMGAAGAYLLIGLIVVGTPILIIFGFVFLLSFLAWLRNAGGAQILGALSVPAFILLFLWWQYGPPSERQVVFKPLPGFATAESHTLAMWDGEIHDDTIDLSLASRLADEIVVFATDSTVTGPATKNLFTRGTGFACSPYAVDGRFQTAQAFGHFDECVLAAPSAALPPEAIAIKMYGRREQIETNLRAAAYLIAEGKPPVEIARWESVRTFWVPKGRSYSGGIDFVLDVFGHGETKELSDHRITLGEWIDLAHDRTSETPIEISTITYIARSSSGQDYLSPIAHQAVNLEPAQWTKLNTIIEESCLWRRRLGEDRFGRTHGKEQFVRSTRQPNCERDYAREFNWLTRRPTSKEARELVREPL